MGRVALADVLPTRLRKLRITDDHWWGERLEVEELMPLVCRGACALRKVVLRPGSRMALECRGFVGEG